MELKKIHLSDSLTGSGQHVKCGDGPMQFIEDGPNRIVAVCIKCNRAVRLLDKGPNEELFEVKKRFYFACATDPQFCRPLGA